jgi:hypothetical protein
VVEKVTFATPNEKEGKRKKKFLDRLGKNDGKAAKKRGDDSRFAAGFASNHGAQL